MWRQSRYIATYVLPGLLTVATWAGCSQGGMSSNEPVVPPAPATRQSFVFPLKVDQTSRYLVDQNDKPFLLVGDAAWSLFVGVSKSDADLYLDNRRQRGFTAILVSLIENKFSANPPANFYKVKPFTQQTFTTPNEIYFSHADYVIQSAAAKGIVVFLAPLYLGFNCGNEGWCGEVTTASMSDMTAWGRYLGNRYKTFDNIVWVIGGDMDPSSPSLPPSLKSNVQAVVDGILSVDTRHLFTAHNAPEQMAVTPWQGATWLNVNTVYTNNFAYQMDLDAYASVPVKPYFLIEAKYENSGPDAQALRAQSYWTVLSGGFGHVFGNCPIWAFDHNVEAFCTLKGWKTQLNSTGAINMQHLQALFNSRHWQMLVPNNAAVTAGLGTFGQEDYATAACATDGSSIIVYIPTSRPVTVNGRTCLSGNTMNAWWYNPSTGAASQIGTFATAGTQPFSPPQPGDWVLVLDNPSIAFPPPGAN